MHPLCLPWIESCLFMTAFALGILPTEMLVVKYSSFSIDLLFNYLFFNIGFF